MEWSLSKARDFLGADDPDTRLLLGRESPEALARRPVEGTKRADPAIRASGDPMIQYALKLSDRQGMLKAEIDARYSGSLTQGGATFADARFATYRDALRACDLRAADQLRPGRGSG